MTPSLPLFFAATHKRVDCTSSLPFPPPHLLIYSCICASGFCSVALLKLFTLSPQGHSDVLVSLFPFLFPLCPGFPLVINHVVTHRCLLQYSCLENPMDRGVWQVHRVAKSWTQLKQLSMHALTSESEALLSILPENLMYSCDFRVPCAHDAQTSWGTPVSVSLTSPPAVPHGTPETIIPAPCQLGSESQEMALGPWGLKPSASSLYQSNQQTPPHSYIMKNLMQEECVKHLIK